MYTKRWLRSLTQFVLEINILSVQCNLNVYLFIIYLLNYLIIYLNTYLVIYLITYIHTYIHNSLLLLY